MRTYLPTGLVLYDILIEQNKKYILHIRSITLEFFSNIGNCKPTGYIHNMNTTGQKLLFKLMNWIFNHHSSLRQFFICTNIIISITNHSIDDFETHQ